MLIICGQIYHAQPADTMHGNRTAFAMMLHIDPKSRGNQKPMKRAFVSLLLLLQLGACSEPEQPSISLYLAVQRGDINQIERHIHWKSDINQLDPDGNYPLQILAKQGKIIGVELLLNNGAEVNAINPAGQSAAGDALLAGRTKVVDLLVKHGAKVDADALLLKAAHDGNNDRDVIRYLVSMGADTEARDAQGDTPLLIAIRLGNHRLARHLVNQGADVNAKTRSGQSALGLAVELNAVDIALLLRQQGAVDGR